MLPSDKAWIVLGVGVVGYNLTAKDAEMMSEAVDRWLVTHPWLTRAAVVAVALHLVNAVPCQVDPLHWLFVLSRRWRRR